MLRNSSSSGAAVLCRAVLCCEAHLHTCFAIKPTHVLCGEDSASQTWPQVPLG